jgi:transposase-like protein
MGLRCKRCGSAEQVKNGLMRAKQRYLCKGCGLNFTDTPARGKPLAMKVAAVLLYVSGLSMNRTAKLLGVATSTVQAWLEQFAAASTQKPEPEGRAVAGQSHMARREGYASPDPSIRSRFLPQKLYQYFPERMILRWNYSSAIALVIGAPDFA